MKPLTWPATETPIRRHVLVPFGTRPEVIKLAPVVHALRAVGHRVTTVDTGQHADAAMGSGVQAALGLIPDVRMSLPDGAGRQGALLATAARIIAEHPADVVLALGDTHTVPAYALAARTAGVPFAHLEAGLRSFNRRSVEEVNRRVANNYLVRVQRQGSPPPPPSCTSRRPGAPPRSCAQRASSSAGSSSSATPSSTHSSAGASTRSAPVAAAASS